MASLKQSSDLAREAANRSFGAGTVVCVRGEATEDSLGEAAIRLVLVVPPERVRELTGRELVDALGLIKRDLSEAGETRTLIVHYATTDDVAVNSDDRP